MLKTERGRLFEHVLTFKNREEHDAVMGLYLERGYAACERGDNLQKTHADFQNALNE